MITAERLRELLTYDPATGEFRWKLVVGQRGRPGKLAGSREVQGYWVIRIDRRLYKAHRLAWLYLYGEWPEKEIDHINCKKDDNRIANLRLASRSQNCSNVSLLQHNTSGIKGVHRRRDRWIAQINIHGRRTTLGTFATPEEASVAYKRAATAHFGAFANV